MNKLTGKCTYNIVSSSENKIIVNFTNNFAIMDINKKNTFDFVYPQLKNCNKLIRSNDNSKTIVLDTRGQGYLFDEIEQVVICKISFGEDFISQFFTAHKNGWYFINNENEIEWYDYVKNTIIQTDICGKYIAIFDDKDKDKAFFISIDDYGVEDNGFGKLLPIGYSLSVKCFSKKLEKFEDWNFSLPKGSLKNFRYVANHQYFVVMEEEKKTERDCIHTRVYLLDLENKTLNFLFNINDLNDWNNDGYFVNLEIEPECKKAYVLYSKKLIVIDLKTNKIISTVPINFASDLKIISNYVVIATWTGVFTIPLSELD